MKGLESKRGELLDLMKEMRRLTEQLLAKREEENKQAEP